MAIHEFIPIHYRRYGTFCSVCHKPMTKCEAWIEKMDLHWLVPDHIDVCASCGYQAWRENYPCNRCGGLTAIRFEPVTRRESAEAPKLKK